MEDARILDLYWARDQRANRRDGPQIRALPLPDRLEHPPGPVRRGGVRQRHIPQRLERHPAGPSQRLPGLAGPGGAEPVPGPVEAGPGGKAGRRAGDAAGGTGGLRPRPPAARSGPWRTGRSRTSSAPFSRRLTKGEPGDLPAAVLVRPDGGGDRVGPELRGRKGEVLPFPHPERPAELFGTGGDRAMKGERLFQILGLVDPELIEEAVSVPAAPRRRTPWRAIAAGRGLSGAGRGRGLGGRLLLAGGGSGSMAAGSDGPAAGGEAEESVTGEASPATASPAGAERPRRSCLTLDRCSP